MNISERLLRLFLAFVIRAVSAHDRKSKTNHCTCDENAWAMREKQFGCEKGNYTCILTEEDELIETCIAPYLLSEQEQGCPYVKKFVQGFGPQIGGKLSQCDVRGCPPTNHSAYYITELYKYPACWIPMTERANTAATVDFQAMCFAVSQIDVLQQPSDHNSERSQSQNGHTLLLTTAVPAVCVTVAIMIVFVILLKHRRNIQRQRQENELRAENHLLSQSRAP